MFIPLIIAILLGLASPSTTSNNSNCNGGTIYVTADAPNPNGDPEDPNNPGDGGEDGPGTIGDTGQTPPPKP